MKILPQFQNLADCVRMFKLAYIIGASFPFRESKTGNNPTILIPVKPGLRKLSEIAVIFAIIFYGQKVRYSFIDPEDYLSYMAVVAVYSTTTLTALTSVIMAMYKQVDALKAVQALNRADYEMKQLGIEITYFFWFVISSLYTASVFLIPVRLFMSNKSWQKKIFGVLALDYSIVIRCAYLSYPIVFSAVILVRLQQLNKKLNELDDGDIIDKAEMRGKMLNVHSFSFILDKASTIYANLIEGFNLFYNSYSVIFLINIASNIVQTTQAMMIIYTGNYKEIVIAELAYIFFICQGQVLALALTSYLIESEAKNIFATLGHLNIYYFHQKLAFKKNTLLLQGLHHKVDNRVCGMFPLNGSIFLKQFSICTTVFLLLLQKYNKSLKE